ncbi:Variable surface protein Vir7-like protein [Plasmodium coatneyi]|uniref:Variable surface protein Vir7-like protein n=1 Tax=Plasmodium coatneyi TaxID=208452 RepID=A0A1B1E302_9APIC|nr:Variable surface protein Vir7-like protein [Plasmodium coatneyi]ANQ09317.1 Variable surface protein Vir7-like protein [Plasmodium coatneyi]
MAKPAGTGYLHSVNLEQLDSKLKFYDRIGGKVVQCTYESENEIVKGQLGACSRIAGEADKISKGLCYISSRKADANLAQDYQYRAYGTDQADEDSDDVSAELEERLNKALCYFFYFWLGNEVWNKIGSADGTKFLSTMECIYKALQLFHIPNNCTIMDTDHTAISKDLFVNRKTVFDFSFDYKGIKDKLGKFSNSCDQGYYDHLDKAVKAYAAVKADCESKPATDPFCTEFKKVYEDCSKKGELKFTYETECIKASTQGPEGISCTLKGTSEQGIEIYKNVNFGCSPNFVWSPGIFVAASSSGNTAVAAISSIFGVAALPTLAFLSYKKHQHLPIPNIPQK